jgi:hypothetical protein
MNFADVKIDDKGYLLSRSIHKDTIKRIIDWKALNITKEEIDEASKLKNDYTDILKPVDKRKLPDFSNEKSLDRFYVIDLSLPYNPPPDNRDQFVWYNDIIMLSGSAGYARIRDGYVYGTRIVMRS